MAQPLNEKTAITGRQRKFVKKLVETGSPNRAAKLSGYSDPTYGSWLAHQPKIQTLLQKELEKAGLAEGKIATEIKNGLKATYVRKDGGSKYPDFHARHKFLDTLIKVRGDYAPEKHEIRQEKLVLVLSPDLKKGLIDAKAVTEAEIDTIEAEVIEEENIDAKEI